MSNQTEEQEQIIICKHLIEAKDYESALRIIEEFLLKYPEDEELLNDKGIILTKFGKYNEAIEYFKKGLKISKEKGTKLKAGTIWNNKGLAYCKLNDFVNAICCFQKSYEINGNAYTNALNNEGLAYYYLGKNTRNKQEREKHFKEAINCFDKVIELNPENSNTYNNKGSTLLELGWDEEASSYIYKALELNPKNANALNNRGRILVKSCKYTEAVEYYNKALEIDKSHREAWNNKGIAMANIANLTDEQKYFLDAEKCYDEAKKIDNKFVDAFNNKSMLYVSRHNFVKAEELIDDSLKIDENNLDTMDKKGIILFHLQKYDEALSWFRRAAAQNLDNKVSRYHMGNVYMQLKKYDEAIECFDDSLKDNLNFAEAHNAKASALFNKGNQKEASKEVKRALEIKPSLAVANENIAKLTTSGSQHFQNFWDFWKSSLFKKIVGITLFVLILSTAGCITYYIISNLLFEKGIDAKGETQLMDISEGYLVTLGIVLFILLIPEIKKAKMGLIEVELEEQHIHPTNDTPSMSEEHHFSQYLSY